MDELFIKAARMKLRFASAKGLLTVEDLFDLPLTSNTGRANLDDIARGLHRELKDNNEVSFVTPEKQNDTATVTAFEIVKHVINVRLAERDAASKEAEKAATRQKIMGIIAQKSDMALAEKSVEELSELLKTL